MDRFVPGEILVECLIFPPDNGLTHTFRLLFCSVPSLTEVHSCSHPKTCCIETATFNKPSIRFTAPPGSPAVQSCYMLSMYSSSSR